MAVNVWGAIWVAEDFEDLVKNSVCGELRKPLQLTWRPFESSIMVAPPRNFRASHFQIRIVGMGIRGVSGSLFHNFKIYR